MQNDQWELRFVGCSIEAPLHLSLDKWQGHVYSRHETESFLGWWRVDSTKNCPGDNWNIAVYNRIKTLSFTNLRNSFLNSIGGQSVMHCSEHDLPLITTKIRQKWTCCLTSLENGLLACPNTIIVLQCPFASCCCKVCSEHAKILKYTSALKLSLGSVQ
jgi:hypothetical protein